MNSALDNLKNWISFLTAFVLLFGTISFPANAYADDDDGNSKLTFQYEPGDLPSTTWNGPSYSQGIFYNRNGELVNSYQQYYINFGDGKKQDLVANYKPPNDYQASVVVTQSLAIASTFAPGVGDFLAIGFTLMAGAAQNQEQAVIDAYGEDFAFTDWLIQVFEQQQAEKVIYDKGFTIVKDYNSKIDHASPQTIEDYNDKNPGSSWHSDKIGLKKDEYGRSAGLDKVRSHVSASTAMPWAGEKTALLPPGGGQGMVAIAMVKLDEAAGSGGFNENSVLEKKEFELGEGDSKLFGDTNQGWTIALHQLSDQELAYLQQLIYYLCSSQDWRMMIAEARNLNIGISRADFENSIQYMMGLTLSGDFDFANLCGVLKLGHYLNPLDPDAAEYARTRLEEYYTKHLFGGETDGAGRREAIEALLNQAEKDGIDVAHLWEKLRNMDDSMLETMAGGDALMVEVYRTMAGHYGADVFAEKVIPTVGKSLIQNGGSIAQEIGAHMTNVSANSAAIGHLVRGAAALDLIVYCANHENMVKNENAKHDMTMAYAALQIDNGQKGNTDVGKTYALDPNTNSGYSKFKDEQDKKRQQQQQQTIDQDTQSKTRPGGSK